MIIREDKFGKYIELDEETRIYQKFGEKVIYIVIGLSWVVLDRVVVEQIIPFLEQFSKTGKL